MISGIPIFPICLPILMSHFRYIAQQMLEWQEKGKIVRQLSVDTLI